MHLAKFRVLGFVPATRSQATADTSPTRTPAKGAATPVDTRTKSESPMKRRPPAAASPLPVKTYAGALSLRNQSPGPQRPAAATTTTASSSDRPPKPVKAVAAAGGGPQQQSERPTAASGSGSEALAIVSATVCDESKTREASSTEDCPSSTSPESAARVFSVETEAEAVQAAASTALAGHTVDRGREVVAAGQNDDSDNGESDGEYDDSWAD